MSAAKKLEPVIRVTTSEAAELMSVDSATIRRWIKRGFLSAYGPPGGRILVDLASIESALARWKK